MSINKLEYGFDVMNFKTQGTVRNENPTDIIISLEDIELYLEKQKMQEADTQHIADQKYSNIYDFYLNSVANLHQIAVSSYLKSNEKNLKKDTLEEVFTKFINKNKEFLQNNKSLVNFLFADFKSIQNQQKENLDNNTEEFFAPLPIETIAEDPFMYLAYMFISVLENKWQRLLEEQYNFIKDMQDQMRQTQESMDAIYDQHVDSFVDHETQIDISLGVEQEWEYLDSTYNLTEEFNLEDPPVVNVEELTAIKTYVDAKTVELASEVEVAQDKLNSMLQLLVTMQSTFKNFLSYKTAIIS